ncbi:DUF362 domain-containing protein [Candidatus Bathyarchaeota archaeon]|nr:DUF362 domain-containing protein [Candidatus Bathyarchaeota archaeon]
MSKVVVQEILSDDIEGALRKIFDQFGGVNSVLGRRKDVYAKINAVDFRKQCYTSPEVIAATIDVLKDGGAKNIYVMDNSTQGNLTRLVFKVIGLDKILKKKGAKPLYLDEEKPIDVTIGENDFRVKFPRILFNNIIQRRSENLYISVPKFKTHTMTTVTLGVKCQLGFLYHEDRPKKHNYNLHQLVADLYGFIKPDFTITDGINAIVNGHYPLEKMIDRYVVPMNLLIGGEDTVAVDAVAAKILGFNLGDVKHLKIAHDAGYGCGDLRKIEIVGDLSKYRGKYSKDFIGMLPEDVTLVEGHDMACIEGCKGNTLMVLEMLHVDHGGHGPFSIVYGNGIKKSELDNLKTPILVVGPCAVKEVGRYLKEKFGDKEVDVVNSHNDLCEVTSKLMKFMGIKTMQVVPLKSSSIVLTWILAKLHGSTAHTPPIF